MKILCTFKIEPAKLYLWCNWFVISNKTVNERVHAHVTQNFVYVVKPINDTILSMIYGW